MPAPTGSGQYKQEGGQLYVSREVTTGKWVWNLVENLEARTGTVVRISTDGSVNTYHAADATNKAQWTALRSALASTIDGDTVIPDRHAIYEYDGTQLSLTGRTGVTIRKFISSRAVTDDYSRIIVLQDCNDCDLSIDFDGRAGIAYEQSYPFNSASAISAVNENEPGGPTYVVEFNNCNRCILRDSEIKQHAGDRILVSGLYPQFDTAYGIHIFSTCRDCEVRDSLFEYCGLSGISSNAPGTIIDGCVIRNAGWHGVRFGNVTSNPGKVTMRNCQLIEDVPRLMGYRTTTNFNGQVNAIETALIENCTFRHDYDWFPDLAAYSGGTTYSNGDAVYYNGGSGTKIYIRQGGTGSGVAPTGLETDNAQWKWAMEFTSTYQLKFGNVQNAVLASSRFEHGQNGDELNVRASIKIEDSTNNLTIDNTYMSGQIIATSLIVDDVNVIIKGKSEINATANAGFAIYVNKIDSLNIQDSQINYEHRAINIPHGNLVTSFTSKDCRYVPLQNAQTESEIILEADIGTAFGAVDFDESNVIVDRTRETVTFTASTDRINSTATAFVDGVKVRFLKEATATAPSGITFSQDYWVINKTANDFQISLTQGGSAETFTTNGSGTFYAKGGEYVDGFIKTGTGHAKSETANGNLLLSGSSHRKLWNGALTNRLAHPTVASDGNLNWTSAFGTQAIDVRNKSWTGSGTLNWTWNGTSWIDSNPMPIRRIQGTVTTTDETATEAATFATLANRSYLVKAWAIGRETVDSDKTGGYIVAATFQNDGGDLTRITTVTTVHHKETTGAWTTGLDATGANIRCRVTGAASTNVDWKVVLEIIEI